MLHKVAFVDDERFFARPYVQYLSQWFDVELLADAEEALGYIQQHIDVRCVILDIMMPAPSGIAATTVGGGLDTGLWLLSQIRDLVLKRPMPVLILTNRSLPVVREGVADIQLPKDLVRIEAKNDVPRFKLPSLVEELIG